MQGRTLGGSIALLAAAGMTLGSIGGEVSNMTSWAQAVTPAFVGSMFIHIAAAVSAYVAGQLIPSSQRLVNTRKP